MEITPREAIEISVVLYPEDGFWIAQGLEFDITARGSSPADASEKFNSKVGAELLISLEVGDETALGGIDPAPQKFWEMFKRARMRAEIDDVPVRITDGGSASRIRPRIKIFDEAA